MSPGSRAFAAADLDRLGADFLPGLLGVRFTRAERGIAEAELPVRKALFAPNGFLHAGAIVALADSCCGAGCMASLPEGAVGFTTIELKSNFLATATEGIVTATARAVHLGRTTQIWDAEAKHRETDKTLALFRCTQMVLWPR